MKLRLALVVGILVWCSPARADTAFDCAFAQFSNSAAQTSASFSAASGNHLACTPAANSNRVLVVDFFTAFSTTPTSITGTWNGVSLGTELGTTNVFSAQRTLHKYCLVNPASGNQTLALSWTGGQDDTYVIGKMYYNASGCANFAAPGSDTTSTAPSQSITSVSGDMVDVCTDTLSSAISVVINAGTLTAANTSNTDQIVGCGRAAASGSSTTVSFTLGASKNWNVIGVDVQAAAASGSGGVAKQKKLRLLQ